MSDLKSDALHFHRYPTAGKIEVNPTKSLVNQRDLSLAYSPGVAFACEEIQADPLQADYLTSRANLVAVISNGTAVLGLGNIGALAGKPVMEGKGVLFKKFAGIDVFDIEIDETDPEKFIETVARLEPTFGGINLEDIKAPECFEIEKKLKERMNIPVFHDDQHGTAIIASAALINALRIQGKEIDKVKIVASGAGAAGMACLKMFRVLGAKVENIVVCDSKGPIYAERGDKLDPTKAEYTASNTSARSLAEAMVGADVFIGVSKGNLVNGEMVKSMAEKPLILALANPNPEILPEEVHKVRDDAIVATGRSDYPNQVNNVLCFPYLFRGALDVGATTINDEMCMAAVYALADLAKSPAGEEVISVYSNENLVFGKEYVIPKPFDPRLITTVPIAVAKAAMDSGVARRPLEDMEAYKNKLAAMFNSSNFIMRPIIEKAKANPLKVAFAEGEDLRVLRAVLACVQEKICKPILIGRKKTILNRIAENALQLTEGKDFEIIEPMNNPYYEQCWNLYHELRSRDGIDPSEAKIQLNTRPTVLAAILVKLGIADTMICGTIGRYNRHLRRIRSIFPAKNTCLSALGLAITKNGSGFITDTHINANPTAKQLADITLNAASFMTRMGITPKIALLSRSNFGDCAEIESSKKMQEALAIIRERKPNLEIEGEMQADVALLPNIRKKIFPNNKLEGQANLLVAPNIDAANISYNLLKIFSDGNVIGPILLGTERPIQVLAKISSSKRIFNMTAIAVVETQNYYRDLKKPTYINE